MLKGAGFGPHSEKYGHRLGKQIAAGATGLARRFVPEEESAGVKQAAAGPRPWEAEGVSRATWFRRKKGGG